MDFCPLRCGIFSFPNIEEELLCIVPGTELVGTATLCFASGDFHISTNNSYPASARTRVLVCGQSTVILTFLKEELL